ncbi:AAEL002778-PA [Aedes aegypti]|uniref:AAEL002778-PA n=1 Tax=Aedes aegypti TaxID=7159 RepID=Q17H37_AEDAE|nr:AAEL002778-PA [Aedes aegypti]
MRPAVVDVLLEQGQGNFAFLGLQSGLIGVHMDIHDVLGQGDVPSLVVDVLHDEDHIETGQNRWHEVDVLLALGIVPTAEDGISRGQNRAARVQGRRDPGLGNRNGLLFHGFVNGHAIVFFHLVELVNTNDSTIRQDHGTSFHDEVPRRRIPNDGSS